MPFNIFSSPSRSPLCCRDPLARPQQNWLSFETTASGANTLNGARGTHRLNPSFTNTVSVDVSMCAPVHMETSIRTSHTQLWIYGGVRLTWRTPKVSRARTTRGSVPEAAACSTLYNATRAANKVRLNVISDYLSSRLLINHQNTRNPPANSCPATVHKQFECVPYTVAPVREQRARALLIRGSIRTVAPQRESLKQVSPSKLCSLSRRSGHVKGLLIGRSPYSLIIFL